MDRKPDVEPLGEARWARIERSLFRRREEERRARVAPPPSPRRASWGRAAALVLAGAAASIAGGLALRAALPAAHVATSRVVTEASASHVNVGDAALEVARESSVEVREEAHATIVLLERGEIALRVPARSADRPLIVEAGDVRVRVVGTELSVRRDGAAAIVRVTRGVVEVRAGGEVSRVAAGESWPARAPSTEVAGAGEAHAQPTAVQPPSDDPASARAPRTPPDGDGARDARRAGDARDTPEPRSARDADGARESAIAIDSKVGSDSKVTNESKVGDDSKVAPPSPRANAPKGATEPKIATGSKGTNGSDVAKQPHGRDESHRARDGQPTSAAADVHDARVTRDDAARASPDPRAAAAREATPQERYEAAERIERTDPAGALAAYAALARGEGAWAQNALYAAGRLQADRGARDDAARLLREYLRRFPDGANAQDARTLLDALR